MSTPATGDTLVTIKVNHNGRMCRFKLPLRDMNVNSLEDKLRAALNIDLSTPCVLERYSDSASAFVVLDRTNISVYKQLYRAAKAKQRLKIKATTPSREKPAVEPEPEQQAEQSAEKEENGAEKEENGAEKEEMQVPKPVTVEDEPELASAAPSEMTEVSKMEPAHVADGHVDHRPVYWGYRCPGQESFHPHPRTIGDLARMQYYPPPQAEKTPAPAPPARPPKEIVTEEEEIIKAVPAAPEPVVDRPTFAVCCNNCDATIPEAHYHCQTCDDGDFDLCQKCVDQGVTCRDDSHWLIKRFVRGGQIINSHTEKISPKPAAKPKVVPEAPVASQPEPVEAPAAPVTISTAPPAPRLTPTKCPMVLCERCRIPRNVCGCGSSGPRPPSYSDRIVPIVQAPRSLGAIRTCNCCVQEYPENMFVHCTVCDDYDLCKACFVKDNHGHHPAHGFEPAVKGDVSDPVVNVRLAAGRNQYHGAICDGCDKDITGVRHKCLDCPDWDYCSECVMNAGFIHAGHRFVPIYDGIKPNANRTVHVGICCDGPLCHGTRGPKYITGVRYKCAVCHDTDFCGNCEASPSNRHNKTHPLIKFKTPVRHVTVTTTGDKRDGAVLPTMGDRLRNNTSSRATSTTTAAANNSSTAIQTVVDLKPAEPEASPKPIETKKEVSTTPAPVAIPKNEDLEAVYVRDLVTDGTVIAPGTVFNQTWILKNVGKVSWPAGCSVKFVGGDYMGHVDTSHVAGVLDLVSANESTICYQPLEPGKEFAFNVLLRTPHREGKTISYWRLSTPDGHRFGHRLWCDINVVSPPSKVEPAIEVKQEPVEETKLEVEQEVSPSESRMIFPKLDKESPVASIHEEVRPEPTPAVHDEPEEGEEFEELAEDDEWDDNDESFNTDEEYDLLDASDEECSEINGKAARN